MKLTKKQVFILVVLNGERSVDVAKEINIQTHEVEKIYRNMMLELKQKYSEKSNLIDRLPVSTGEWKFMRKYVAEELIKLDSSWSRAIKRCPKMFAEQNKINQKLKAKLAAASRAKSTSKRGSREGRGPYNVSYART